MNSSPPEADPRDSVVMPAYNHERYVGAAIDDFAGRRKVKNARWRRQWPMSHGT